MPTPPVPARTGCAADQLTVAPVVGRAERGEFLRFPWQIYRHDPHWVPPLLWERGQFIDQKRHPFFRYGTAQLFLARRDGRPVGRIMVSVDPRYNEHHGTQQGCFGLFEAENDPAIAAALFAAGADWLRAQGCRTLVGPIEYSLNYSGGLLIDGFDAPPRVMMNHNPPYYAALLEGSGFRKAKDLYSWWFDDPHNLEENWRDRMEKLARRSKIVIRPFRLADMQAEVARCSRIYNEAWKDNWGFVPMLDAEIQHLAKELRQWAVPQMLLIAEVAGQPIGFAMSLPDLNEALRSLNGRLFTWGLPVGLARLAWNLRRVRTCRLVTLGVLPEYRRRGAAELLIYRTLTTGKGELGYAGAELGWTLEDNELINRPIELVGARRYKTYRIYERPIV